MNAAAVAWAERRRFARVSLSTQVGQTTLGPRGKAGLHVLDFSPGGVSVAAGEAAPWSGEEMPLSFRLLDWEIPCKLNAEPTGRAWAGGSQPLDGERLGLALSFEPQAQEQVAKLYHRLRFPELQRRHTFAPAEVQRLFADSGYLALRSGLEPDRTWTDSSWPSTLSHEALFRDQSGRPSGHIAVTRAYRNAWLGHEIATLSDTPDKARCRRDLYQHFCVWPRLQDGESTHAFGYYNPKRRFHQQMFEAFASRSSTDECVVVRMERYMPDAAFSSQRLDRVGHDLAAQGSFSVEPLQAADEPAALNVLACYLPALALSAFDLRPAGLSQDTLHPDFAALGLQRGRKCLVVRAGEGIVAVLLCEWDSTRLSLFDVLSVAHVYLSPNVEPTPDIESTIAGAVRSFYASRGARVPLLTCPPGTFHRRNLPGFAWAETMACIVFSAPALRAFETYVELCLGPESTGMNQGCRSTFEERS